MSKLGKIKSLIVSSIPSNSFPNVFGNNLNGFKDDHVFKIFNDIDFFINDINNREESSFNNMLLARLYQIKCFKEYISFNNFKNLEVTKSSDTSPKNCTVFVMEGECFVAISSESAMTFERNVIPIDYSLSSLIEIGNVKFV